VLLTVPIIRTLGSSASEGGNVGMKQGGRRRVLAAASLVFTTGLAIGDVAVPAASLVAPTLVQSSHIGWKVDKTNGGNVCTVASHDECQLGTRGSDGGGFYYPSSLAVDPKTGDVYVAELGNDRVQELTAAGAFVSMFGWDVNETKSKQTAARQTEKNACTAASKDVCTMGVAGTSAGRLASPASIAVDPVTGDLYILEVEADNLRVEKYAHDGRFVWMIGKSVNRTTKENLCTEREIQRARAHCGAGAENVSESTQHGAFKFGQQSGDLLAVGGPEHLLYVGDEHRVQVFGTDGRWKREILLASISAEPHSSVAALALSASGKLYLVYRVGKIETYLPTEHADIVHEFNSRGEQIAEYSVSKGHLDALYSIGGMAIDGSGDLALTGVEVGVGSSARFGLLYNAGTGALLSGFTDPPDTDGIAFDADGDLYVTTAVDQEIVSYVPAPSAGLATSPASWEVGLRGCACTSG
jgi:NHL repeat-containing protein